MNAHNKARAVLHANIARFRGRFKCLFAACFAMSDGRLSVAKVLLSSRTKVFGRQVVKQDDTLSVKQMDSVLKRS